MENQRRFTILSIKMDNQLKPIPQQALDRSLEKTKLDIGLVGKLFGKGDAVKLNVAALCFLLLVVSGIIKSFTQFENSIDYWKTISPLITLTLGYIWGKERGK
jgi:hypothetical protein